MIFVWWVLTAAARPGDRCADVLEVDDFPPVVLEGSRVGPGSIPLTFGGPGPRMAPIIVVRTDWNTEMLQSVDEITTVVPELRVGRRGLPRPPRQGCVARRHRRSE